MADKSIDAVVLMKKTQNMFCKARMYNGNIMVFTPEGQLIPGQSAVTIEQGLDKIPRARIEVYIDLSELHSPDT